MTKIILVRHGQTAWNREERFRGHADIPLDETGFAQAKATGIRIASQWKPEAIYAGPLSRTIQTAESTAHLFNLMVRVEPGLIDVDCGQWQGLTPDEASQHWPAEFQAYLHAPGDFRFPGGEALEMARLRAMKCVDGLIARYPDQTIVMVSHTALNRLILLSVLGMDSRSFWKIRQDTCAINAFETEDNKFTLTLLNETSHLLSIRVSPEESKTV
jgi:broad specificity phosphatase PhoE